MQVLRAKPRLEITNESICVVCDLRCWQCICYVVTGEFKMLLIVLCNVTEI
jgi:hypothetical protein